MSSVSGYPMFVQQHPQRRERAPRHWVSTFFHETPIEYEYEMPWCDLYSMLRTVKLAPAPLREFKVTELVGTETTVSVRSANRIGRHVQRIEGVATAPVTKTFQNPSNTETHALPSDGSAIDVVLAFDNRFIVAELAQPLTLQQARTTSIAALDTNLVGRPTAWKTVWIAWTPYTITDMGLLYNALHIDYSQYRLMADGAMLGAGVQCQDVADGTTLVLIPRRTTSLVVDSIPRDQRVVVDGRVWTVQEMATTPLFQLEAGEHVGTVSRSNDVVEIVVQFYTPGLLSAVVRFISSELGYNSVRMDVFKDQTYQQLLDSFVCTYARYHGARVTNFSHPLADQVDPTATIRIECDGDVNHEFQLSYLIHHTDLNTTMYGYPMRYSALYHRLGDQRIQDTNGQGRGATAVTVLKKELRMQWKHGAREDVDTNTPPSGVVITPSKVLFAENHGLLSEHAVALDALHKRAQLRVDGVVFPAQFWNIVPLKHVRSRFRDVKMQLDHSPDWARMSLRIDGHWNDVPFDYLKTEDVVPLVRRFLKAVLRDAERMRTVVNSHVQYTPASTAEPRDVTLHVNAAKTVRITQAWTCTDLLAASWMHHVLELTEPIPIEEEHLWLVANGPVRLSDSTVHVRVGPVTTPLFICTFNKRYLRFTMPPTRTSFVKRLRQCQRPEWFQYTLTYELKEELPGLFIPLFGEPAPGGPKTVTVTVKHAHTSVDVQVPVGAGTTYRDVRLHVMYEIEKSIFEYTFIVGSSNLELHEEHRVCAATSLVLQQLPKTKLVWVVADGAVHVTSFRTATQTLLRVFVQLELGEVSSYNVVDARNNARARETLATTSVLIATKTGGLPANNDVTVPKLPAPTKIPELKVPTRVRVRRVATLLLACALVAAMLLVVQATRMKKTCVVL